SVGNGLEYLGAARRFDRSRSDDVDPDPSWGERLGESLRVGGQRGLRRRVVQERRLRGLRHVGADVDDGGAGAGFLQSRKSGVDDTNRGEEVDVERVLPFGVGDGSGASEVDPGGASVVYDDVETAERLEGLVDKLAGA